ncbi:hypothetical protein RRG08_035723 [Elysia crispata]|uniref:Uncharacterized protein n=1 Tax=Elysia crispata TaxID=231223 RepID=A0AAE1CZB4_9GAST|nr:hypothetical protein RRG08_035723 [Elysia crispata]
MTDTDSNLCTSLHRNFRRRESSLPFFVIKKASQSQCINIYYRRGGYTNSTLCSASRNCPDLLQFISSADSTAKEI